MPPPPPPPPSPPFLPIPHLQSQAYYWVSIRTVHYFYTTFIICSVGKFDEIKWTHCNCPSYADVLPYSFIYSAFRLETKNVHGSYPEFVSFCIMYYPTKFWSCIIFCRFLTYFMPYSPYYYTRTDMRVEKAWVRNLFFQRMGSEFINTRILITRKKFL